MVDAETLLTDPEVLPRLLDELENRLTALEEEIFHLKNPTKKDLPARPPINERLET